MSVPQCNIMLHCKIGKAKRRRSALESILHGRNGDLVSRQIENECCAARSKAVRTGVKPFVTGRPVGSKLARRDRRPVEGPEDPIMHSARLSILGVALSVLISQPALADYLSGVAAYERYDFATAYAELRPLAERGDPRAQNHVGTMYYLGRGVAQDYAEAARWYRAAADRGDAGGRSNLASLYLAGLGVAQDYGAALRLFRAAADQGDPVAMTNLGYMHFNGLGVRADRAEAIRWYRSAAAAGQAVAQYSLANMYENGWGMPKDMAEARRWYAAAADQGDADAQAALRRLAQTSALPDATR